MEYWYCILACIPVLVSYPSTTVKQDGRTTNPLFFRPWNPSVFWRVTYEMTRAEWELALHAPIGTHIFARLTHSLYWYSPHISVPLVLVLECAVDL